MAYLAADSDVTARTGWPNALDDGGTARRPDDMDAGHLNSPHAVAVSPGSDLVVAEWVIGGRYTMVPARNT